MKMSYGNLLKRVAAMVVIVLVLGAVVYRLLPPSEAGRLAVSQLAKADRFSLGATGYGGSIPEREELFLTILSSRHAGRLFGELFEQGTAEAKLYALAGLHVAGKSDFKEYTARFIQQDWRVQTQGGCILGEGTAAECVAAIERGGVEQYLKLREGFVNSKTD